MHPPKIVHIVSRLNVGGLAQQVLAIHEGLTQEGLECSLITGETGEHEGNMLDFVPSPSRIYKIPEMGRSIHFFSDLKAFWKLFRYLRKSRPNVVHTHAAKAGALGRLAGFLAGTPIRVHSFHGHVFHGYFSPFGSAVSVLIERVLGKITTAVILPCESQSREISETFRVVPTRKTRIVRYGIPVDSFKNLPDRKEARRFLELPNDSLFVGAIGRMAPIKNHALLIESFSRLPSHLDGRSVKLLVVGDGECRAEIEKQIESRNLTSRVHIRPWLKDLRWAYAAIDVFALTSRNEGMPIAVMEAMASGVSTVSMAVGGVVDLVEDGETGLLVKEQAAESFSRQLVAMLCDLNLRKKISSNAQKHVEEMYSERILIQNMKNLYGELLN